MTDLERLKPIPYLYIDDQMRFWGNVKRTDYCWLWLGKPNTGGYGEFVMRKDGRFLTHRISYYLTYGEPGRNLVCHECNNRICVRPEHLYLGTQADNMKQSQVEGRRNRFGELAQQARFTNHEVIRIRNRIANGELKNHLAKEFGVSCNAMCDIASGKTYANAEREILSSFSDVSESSFGELS